MPGRFPQLNSLGQRQACGEWPNNEQEFTATCPTGDIGEPVTVTIPPGTFYADTIENADELALEDAQEQAEAALECEGTYTCETGLPSPMEPAVSALIIDLRIDTFGPSGTFGVFEDMYAITGVLSEDGNKIALNVDQEQVGPPAILNANRAVWQLVAGEFDLMYFVADAPSNYYLQAINRLEDVAGYYNLGEGQIEAAAWFTSEQVEGGGRPLNTYPGTTDFDSIADDGTPFTGPHWDRCSRRRVTVGSEIEEDIEGDWTVVSFIPSGYDSAAYGAISGNGRRWFATAVQEGETLLLIMDDETVTEAVSFPSGITPSIVLGCASNGSACYGSDWHWKEGVGMRTIPEVLADAGLTPNPVYITFFFGSNCAMSATGQHMLITVTTLTSTNVLYVKIP